MDDKTVWFSVKQAIFASSRRRGIFCPCLVLFLWGLRTAKLERWELRSHNFEQVTMNSELWTMKYEWLLASYDVRVVNWHVELRIMICDLSHRIVDYELWAVHGEGIVCGASQSMDCHLRNVNCWIRWSLYMIMQKPPRGSSKGSLRHCFRMPRRSREGVLQTCWSVLEKGVLGSHGHTWKFGNQWTRRAQLQYLCESVLEIIEFAKALDTIVVIRGDGKSCDVVSA